MPGKPATLPRAHTQRRNMARDRVIWRKQAVAQRFDRLTHQRTARRATLEKAAAGREGLEIAVWVMVIRREGEGTNSTPMHGRTLPQSPAPRTPDSGGTRPPTGHRAGDRKQLHATTNQAGQAAADGGKSGGNQPTSQPAGRRGRQCTGGRTPVGVALGLGVAVPVAVPAGGHARAHHRLARPRDKAPPGAAGQAGQCRWGTGGSSEQQRGGGG